MIYLDAAATTLQKPKEVARASSRAIRQLATPGRGGHTAAMAASAMVYDCREAAARLFDADAEQVVFTQNATHGLNLAIRSVVRPGDRVVISGFEHNAVVRPLVAAGARISCVGTRLFDPADTVDAFERAVTEGTRAVVCTMVSNVFGYVLPIYAIATIAAKAGAAFIVDASQAAGVLPVRLRELGADFIAMPGHKGLLGPQGTGILLCREGGEPLLFGGTGSQSLPAVMPEELPERLEAGTQNICGIAGLREGLRYLTLHKPEKLLAHERALLRIACEGLREIPGIRIFADPEGMQTGVLSLTVAGRDPEEIARTLAAHGVAVRAGLHCAPLAHLSAGTAPAGTVRISVSPFNTARQMEKLTEILSKICE